MSEKSEIKILGDNVNHYYNQIKEINSKTNIQQKIILFDNFYFFYSKFMSFLNKLLLITKIKNLNAEKKAEKLQKIKFLQKYFTQKKIYIDKILLGLSDKDIIIPIEQKDKKNQFLKSKKLANTIQIENENRNSHSINELSKQLEYNYYFIHDSKNPTEEYFILFYEAYNKLMQELNKINIPKSKNNIDKIKKGLIAKKINIDIIFNILIGNNPTIQISNQKRIANNLTPKNLVLSNENKIVLPSSPIIKSFEYQVQNNKLNQLKELELKKKVAELNKTEEAELKKLKAELNKKYNNELNKLAEEFQNV